MGSSIEFNDTLQITSQQGFPIGILNLEKHRKEPLKLENKIIGMLTSDLLKDIEFTFCKDGARVYHPTPTRCFLVQNIDGKWLYWGHAVITEQTIKGSEEYRLTSGKFKITKIYDPEYQKLVTINESPKGKSYF